MLVNEKIAKLRMQMNSAGVDAYIIGSSDPHQSEYAPEYWKGRYWISGFHGSAGTVVVSQNHAGLWTDVRYFLQAEQELAGSEIQLHKMKVQTQAEYLDWILENLKEGQVVGLDFWCFSLSQINYFDKILTEKKLRLKDCGDLLAPFWNDRQPLPLDPIFEHDSKFAPSSRAEKLQIVHKEMKAKEADYFLVSALDEVAYILNLRGRDVESNPVFVAYLMLQLGQQTLYINPQKVSAELLIKLQEDNVLIKEYQELFSDLSKLNSNHKIWIDSSTLNAKISLSLPQGSIIYSPSCIMNMKAQKSPAEISHIRTAMAKDGAALVRSMMWLESQLDNNANVSEFDFAMQIAQERSKMPHYFGESFNAIIGYRSNGAIIHYRPPATGSALIRKAGVLLCDSGGQYEDGTTDITRTIALGEVSDEIKIHYTAVLKGHIDLDKLIFPKGTKGIQMDILARRHLWNLNLNFGHGTGHGVGYFMNVHEPPQGFVSAWNQRGMTEFLPGMLTSNEPGFYQEGSHGIRIENLVVVQPVSGSEEFYCFENLTLFPIDTSLIFSAHFGAEYQNWLNDYHKKVWNQVSPWLNEKEQAWLKKNTEIYKA
ncbi:MAG TPA: aminopeptidase P family protein [Saprospiraceae bacterium]|nr:aminopeptidase P family protein [Saprospiraceae bacterium]